MRRSWLRSAPPWAVGGVSAAPDAAGRVAAGIERASVLAPVGEVEAGAVSAARVERSVGAEREGARRMTRVLLAPVLDEDLLRARHQSPAAWSRESRPLTTQPSTGRAGRRRARIGRRSGGSPARRRASDRSVVRVEDVDVGIARERRRQRHSKQAAIPEVVDLGAEVGEDRRRRVGHVREHLDEAALLRDEHPAIAREPNHGRIDEAAEHDALREPGGQCRRLSVSKLPARNAGEQRCHQEQHERPPRQACKTNRHSHPPVFTIPQAQYGRPALSRRGGNVPSLCHVSDVVTTFPGASPAERCPRGSLSRRLSG